MLAALRARGIEPDYVIGHSVGEFAALAAAEVDRRSGRRSRSSASAGWRWPRRRSERPGSMAAILGLDDEVVERLCRKILGVWPANYNCPGQIVDLRARTTRSTSAAPRPRRQARRRTVKLKVSGAFHSPLVARAAERLRPAIDARHVRASRQAAFMSTVTARFEDRAADGARCSSTS